MVSYDKINKCLPQNLRFVKDLFGDSSIIPNLLLQEYQQLSLSAYELVLLLRILNINNFAQGFTLVDLCRKFIVNDKEAANIIAIFLEKGLLTQVSNGEELLYSFDNLFCELWEIWCYNQTSQCNVDDKKDDFIAAPAKQPEDNVLGKLYQSFEKEIGRGLSPLENEQLSTWLNDDQFSPDLILEALRRAVFQGKISFSYIDKILLSWKQQNLRTLVEIRARDNHANPAHKVKPKKTIKNSEYKGVYNKLFNQ